MLIFLQRVNKFSALYQTRVFITVLTTAPICPYSMPDESSLLPSNLYIFKNNFNTIFPSTLRSYQSFHFFMLQRQHLLRIAFLRRSCHMFCLSHPPCSITLVMSVEEEGLWSYSLCAFDRHVKPPLSVDLPIFPYIRFISRLVSCFYTSSTCYPHTICRRLYYALLMVLMRA